MEITEKREKGHVIKEKKEAIEQTVIEDGVPVKKAEEIIEMKVALDRNAATVSGIKDSFLDKKDRELGSTMLQKKKELLDPSASKEKKRKKPQGKKTELQLLGELDALVDKLTLKYFRNKQYAPKAEKISRIFRRLSEKSLQRVFLKILSRSDNVYVILYVLSRIAVGGSKKGKDLPAPALSINPFLSDECIRQFSLFVRALKHIYNETVPISGIVIKVFESCILSDVKIETAYMLISELQQTDETRILFVNLYGKAHVINYYREVAEGILLEHPDRKLLLALMFTVGDLDIVKKPLEPVLAKIKECMEKNTWGKDVLAFCRCIWALLSAYPGAFDGQFGYLLSLFSYLSGSFKEGVCEYLSPEGVAEITDAVEILANTIINRSVKISGAGGSGRNSVLENVKKYISMSRKKNDKRNQVQMVPDMLSEADKQTYTSALEAKTGEGGPASGKQASGAAGIKNSRQTSESSLKNSSINPNRISSFLAVVKTAYTETLEKIKQNGKDTASVSYSSLLQYVAYIRIAYLLVYFSRISGSTMIDYAEYFRVLEDVSIPNEAKNAIAAEKLEDLVDLLLAEKWNALGYLTKEGAGRPDPHLLSADLLHCKAPVLIFEKITDTADLFVYPSPSMLITAGHVYDVILLVTLPKMVKHAKFESMIRETISVLISRCKKEALALLMRRLIELDCLYSDAHSKTPLDGSRIPDEYIPHRRFVRTAVASLFLTEIDLTRTDITGTASQEKDYSTMHMKLTKKTEKNPVTQKEEYKIVEEIEFVKHGTEKSREKTEEQMFLAAVREGCNVDKKRRLVVLNYVRDTADADLTDKFVKALIKLFKTVSLSPSMEIFVMQSLIFLRKRVALPPATGKDLLVFASEVYKNDRCSEETRKMAQVLYADAQGALGEELHIDASTYNGLVLALLVFITTKKGNIEYLKTQFFPICDVITEQEREELLVLYARAGVPSSPKIAKKPSRVLEEYNKSRMAAESLDTNLDIGIF